MTGAGDEEKLKKAKKIILYVFIGIAIMWLAYAIVNWFISRVVIEAKKTTMNSNSSIVSLFIPTANAYTESDFNTFDYYKRELEKLKTQAGTEYYENKVISEGTLSTIQSIITQAIDTLPDNPDYEVKNTEIVTQLQAIIRKTIKDSKSSSQAKEMITGIETFLKNVQVDRIKAEIQVNPENGNAPLTVTFNAIGASDPS